MPKKQKDVTLVNMVVTGDLKKNLVLETIATKISRAEYNPEQFPGLILRTRKPRSSILLFTNGKFVCTGARSIEDAKKAVNNTIKLLATIGYKINPKIDLTVQNMVASGSVGFGLNLDMLAMKLKNTEYEPEQFPGLVYKLKGTTATFLLFSNGKIVCTGTKSIEMIHTALNKLINELKKVEGKN